MVMSLLRCSRLARSYLPLVFPVYWSLYPAFHPYTFIPGLLLPIFCFDSQTLPHVMFKHTHLHTCFCDSRIAICIPWTPLEQDILYHTYHCICISVA